MTITLWQVEYVPIPALLVAPSIPCLHACAPLKSGGRTRIHQSLETHAVSPCIYNVTGAVRKLALFGILFGSTA